LSFLRNFLCWNDRPLQPHQRSSSRPEHLPPFQPISRLRDGSTALGAAEHSTDTNQTVWFGCTRKQENDYHREMRVVVHEPTVYSVVCFKSPSSHKCNSPITRRCVPYIGQWSISNTSSRSRPGKMAPGLVNMLHSLKNRQKGRAQNP
jgi:hypothetical protein